MKDLKDSIEKHYKIEVINLELKRDMIGKVFDVYSNENRYILKLYKSALMKNIQSFKVIDYLYDQNINDLRIYKNKEENLYSVFFVEEEIYFGVLFNYINGFFPDKEKDFDSLVKTLKSFHDSMGNYSNSTLEPELCFYVDRFTKLLKDKNYNKEKSKRLEDIGIELYKNIDILEKSYCHGDFHNNNIIVQNNKLVMIDFDACSLCNRMIDIATISDMINFNSYNEDDLYKTIERINYCSKNYYHFSDKEILAAISFLAIRHYELIATIAIHRGLDTISIGFLDQQYEWILSFYNSFRKIKLDYINN
ncbi:phosphotransferase [Candidatus Izemoplasma sp. B36]|uniref:phosphotransferase n=1 Tax=Candidatus Izemoplasma sp. B36 TaxID=3242468 RepID=UPI003557184B